MKHLPVPDAVEAVRTDTSELSLAEWLPEIESSFDRAAASGVLEQQLQLTAGPVRIRFAGAAIRTQLGRAFEHLAGTDHETPDLTICVWDSEQSGAAPPPLPPAPDADGPRGTMLYASDDCVQVAYQVGLGQLSAYDRESGTAWFWCRSATGLPFWEPSAPFRQILHWWLAERGMLLVHGAAVGRPEGGVLLAGRGGSGKSTCALSTLASPLVYAGDDYVVLDPRPPEPRVHSLYCSGKLDPGHATRLPHLPAPDYPGDSAADEKAVFYVDEEFPDRMCRGFPLAAVVAPRVNGSESRAAPLGVAEALRALAPSTLLQLVPACPEALTRMARLLDSVPSYRLEVGGPVESIPPAIQSILDEVGA